MFSRLITTVLAVFLIASCFVPSARAVIVELHEGGRSVHGRLVQLTPQNLVIDQTGSDGVTTRREFSRQEIARLTLNVSDDRLTALDPQQPEAYFQYAEELFPLREDPDAQLTACRLYLIAGHLNPARFGEPALERLVVLARSAAEERTFRAMLYLLQAEQQKSTRIGLTDSEDPTLLDSPGVEGLLSSLQALRSGARRSALQLLARPDVKEALRRLHGGLTANELEQLAHGECSACLDGRIDCDRCQGKGVALVSGGEVPCPPCRGSGLLQCTACRGHDFFTRPSNEAMRKLLALELEIMRQREGKAADRRLPPDYRNWSHANRSTSPAITLLDWTSITELDPRQSVYLGDRWVRP